LFAKQGTGPEFFVHDPVVNGRPADQVERFTDPSKEFELVVTDEADREHRFRVVARNNYHVVRVDLTATWRGRVELLCHGLSSIWRALTGR
jgi:hypothetical protein